MSGRAAASWPTGVGLQLHITEGDEDHEIAQTLAGHRAQRRALNLPGEAHYFAEHDQQAAARLTDAPSTSSRRS